MPNTFTAVEEPHFLHRSLFTLLGFVVYGLSLFALALVSAGAGDGSYIPFRIFSAPLGLLSFKAGLFGVPVVWISAAFLLNWMPLGIARVGFLGLLMCHYLGVLVILINTTPSEWVQLVELAGSLSPGMFILGGFVIYLVGQGLMWAMFRRRKALNATPP